MSVLLFLLSQAFLRLFTLWEADEEAGDLCAGTSSRVVAEEVKAENEVYQPLGRAVGQIAGTFIIAENDKGMVIVDMHAAHERIVYERLKKSFDRREVVTQQFLIPYVFSVTEEQMAVFEECRGPNRRVGSGFISRWSDTA